MAQGEGRSKNIASRCTLDAGNSSGNSPDTYYLLRDGSCRYPFTIAGAGRQSLNVELSGNAARGVYIKWGKRASRWTLEATLADGTVVSRDCGLDGYIQEYQELPEGTVSFRIVTSDGERNTLRIVELEVYSPGTLPDKVHLWQPTPTTAELMVVSTHQDDEILFFGGTLPYYAGELKLDTVVVYTAYDNPERLHEALEGLWECGATQHPIFLYYPDKYCYSINQARNIWDQDSLTRDLARLMASHRPQVVVTQDEFGEYGHGQHLLTVDSVKQALTCAADAEYMSRELPSLEPWPVKKCYLHLYANGSISLEWGAMPLDSLGGRTALAVARDAYKHHKSQQIFEYSVSTSRYDCRRFGLYHTSVGADNAKNDFFEHITLRHRHVRPPDSALPDYLERVGSRGWLYRRTDEGSHAAEYLRYCEVEGKTGWYAADDTGALLQPASAQVLFRDVPLDLEQYETLTLIGNDPAVYLYDDGSGESLFAVRYGAVETGSVCFYAVDGSGALPQELVTVEVSRERVVLEERQSIVSDTQSSAGTLLTPIGVKGVIIIVSCMLVATALILSLTLWQVKRMHLRREGKHSRYR